LGLWWRAISKGKMGKKSPEFYKKIKKILIFFKNWGIISPKENNLKIVKPTA